MERLATVYMLDFDRWAPVTAQSRESVDRARVARDNEREQLAGVGQYVNERGKVKRTD